MYIYVLIPIYICIYVYLIWKKNGREGERGVLTINANSLNAFPSTGILIQ